MVLLDGAKSIIVLNSLGIKTGVRICLSCYREYRL